MKYILLLLAALVISASSAFQLHHHISSTAAGKRYDGINKLWSSREEEIAKLEEQLKLLKEEKVAAAVEEEESLTVQMPTEETPMELFVSEKWKEGEDTTTTTESSSGISVTNVVGAIGLVVGLVVFSQIPVGQEDFSKYSISPPSNEIDLGDLNRSRNSSY